MEVQVLCAFFYHLLLPLSLVGACLFRYNALSLIYLLYLLLLPLFFGPSERSIRGHTGRLIKALLVTSILFLCAHTGFQIALYVLKDTDFLGYNCSRWETLSRHIGVTRLDLNDVPNCIRIIAPDFGIFLISCITLGFCNRLTKKNKSISDKGEESIESDEQDEEEGTEVDEATEDEEDATEDEEEATEQERRRQSRTATLAQLRVVAQKFLETMGKVVAVIFLALAGIAVPCGFSGVYFLLFIGICTWWACHLPMSHVGFNTICVMVGFYTAGHIICLYIYQTAFFQQMFPPSGLWSRLFGLKDIIHSNSSSPHQLILNEAHEWPVYVNPGILLLLYYTLATLLKLKKVESSITTDNAQENAEDRVELTNTETWSKNRGEREDETKPMLPFANENPEGQSFRTHVIPGSSHPDPDEVVSHNTSEAKSPKSPLSEIGRVIMQQSYICVLIMMMVWSITFHSWLTFVLLLWACLIWIVRSRRHFALLCSPFILLYGIVLCGLQYVWGMDLSEELPTKLGFMDLKQLGLVRAPYHCLRLGAVLLYTLTFWLLMRQFIKEKCIRRKDIPLKEVNIPEQDQGKSDLLKTLGEIVIQFYSKYWIYVCGGMFIVVSFAGRIVVYKIVYMFLFLLCLSFYQICYFLWRKLLKLFWWLVIAYTMLVLISVYTFQFADFPHYWKNFTGLTDEQLADLGLVQFSVGELFYSILIPGFFLLACILQLHYFHQHFMVITDLEHVPAKGTGPLYRLKENLAQRSKQTAPAAPAQQNGEVEDLGCEENERTELEGGAVRSKWGLVFDRLLVLFLKSSEVLSRIKECVWQFLELHMVKLVALFSVWVAVREPSIMNFLFIVLWAFAVPYIKFRSMASCISTMWACIIIVCKMLYQLNIVNPEEYSNNCTMSFPNETNLKPEEIALSTLYREPVDPANWFGFKKTSPLLPYIKNHLVLLTLLVFEVTVYRHQQHFRKRDQLSSPLVHLIFQDITRQDLDKGLVSCAKYFINFFFHKFGLEICLLMIVNVIGQRMNFLMLFHSCWLVAILTRRKRAMIAKLWPKYCLFQSLFLMYQYLLCVGMPPALCLDYPWRWAAPITINSNLIKWLFLPDFVTLPNATHLMYDFLLLVCASQQWQVFRNEKKEEMIIAAGENTDDSDPMVGREQNPVPNFINCRSYLDMLKVVVFRYIFWLVLAVVFATGSTRISVFGGGYLLASFYLLLFGRKLLMKPAGNYLNLWDCLIMYNVMVIISKNMLSLLACVFLKQLQSNFCWLIQLFSLHCTIKGYYNEQELQHKDCSLAIGEAGIIWDSICFFFLLLQRRIFLSYYFIHVAADLRASTLQASRGFQLFKARIIKNMNYRREAEKSSLAQLKRQMERIRAKQERSREGRKDTSETVGKEQPATKKESQQKKKWWRPWLDHAKVLQSGEYYLFESDSEEEDESVLDEQKPHKQSAFQLAYQAWVTNAKQALKERNERKEQLLQFEREARRQQRLLKAGVAKGEETEVLEGSSVDGDEENVVSSKSNVVQRVMDILRFLGILFLVMVTGLTQWLNTLVKPYIDTSTILWRERYVLIQKLAKGEEVVGETLDDLYQMPDDSSEMLLANADSEEARAEKDSKDSNTSRSEQEALQEEQEDVQSIQDGEEIPVLDPDNETHACTEGQKLDMDPPESVRPSKELDVYLIIRTRTASELLANSNFCIQELKDSEKFYDSQNRCLKLVYAVYNVIAANSELTCYFIIILNNMISASVISLFLPILIFLWGMLSIPRPSKRFWMVAIVYTEIMILVKYIFQFGFFPWNSFYIISFFEDKPFFPPRILGLYKSDDYLKYDLIQLLALLFHQSLLKRYGLWDEQEESKKNHEKKINSVQAPKEEKAATDEQTPEKKTSRFLFRRRKQDKEKENSEKPKRKEKKKKKKKRERISKKLIEFGKKVKNFLISIAMSIYTPLKSFFSSILHTKYRAATDVYALMFLADVVDFVIIIFGFWAFGKHSAAADIASSLSDDQVPEGFLVMVLIQFSTMVIDRALYLRKTVLGKLIFQVLLVFGIHVWMFFILPAVSERMFSHNIVVQLWYFVKCIYFALSAYQIRCGYPTRILGNFLTKKYNHLNLFLFQGFRLVPFLVELRAVMDWVWTDTTLSLSSWMSVEDIYANIFIIKCSRETEKRYPQPKGKKKKKIVKYGMGGLIIAFLICVIWFPLLFMSLVKSVVGVVNHPIDVTVTVKLGGYEPLFTMSAQQQSLKPFTQKDYEDLCSTFERKPAAMQFITLYSYEDIITAHVEGNSGSLWNISPPSRKAMIDELESNSVMTLRYMWNFQRDLTLGGTVEHSSDKHIINLSPEDPVREQLANLLQGNRKEPVVISHMIPKYTRAPHGPEAKPVHQINEENAYLNVTMELHRYIQLDANKTDSILEWWVIKTKSKECKQHACNELQMVIFSDKVSPPSLGLLAGYGIMGLYVSIVLVVGKFVREFFSDISHSIMFEELPCVDRVLKLCHDIFLVRENGEFELEEELFAKLIFLYRSPETMIKWTRED
ncbi:piezo-type mechanosensitive ion channel component 1 isoform X1 [Callorhinchus milii]|uniref:piezo-type mechanosensitive ion channel component 1 isoform X1 n=2 Tax=Callorhinchus milii TaxID=7868 RepID=UPI001C3FB415|nr:piezo-type mechanosensitive ion channel component 1 isoform X1 [Callorhinchus milii]